MAKYKLIVNTTWTGAGDIVELDDFTDEDYEKYLKHDPGIMNDYEMAAREIVDMEWDIKKIEDE